MGAHHTLLNIMLSKLHMNCSKAYESFLSVVSPTSKVKIWTEDKSILGNWDVRIKKEDLFSGIFSHSYLRFFSPLNSKYSNSYLLHSSSKTDLNHLLILKCSSTVSHDT